MTINDEPPRIQAVASGGQTIFTYNFEIFDSTDLKVYARAAGSVADDSSDIQQLTVDYTVTGVGSETGGTIVFLVGRTNGDIITIIGDANIDRSTNFVDGGTFTATTVNLEYDKQVSFSKQNKSKAVEIPPHYQNSAIIENKDLKLPILAASQYWQKDSLNNGFIAAECTEEAGCSTLRSELASEATGADGSRLVGYESVPAGPTTVNAYLGVLKTEIDSIVGDDDRVKVTTNDTTPDFLDNKLLLTDNGALTKVVQNPAANENILVTSIVIPEEIHGLYTVPGADSDHDIEIKPGGGVAANALQWIVLSADITKQIDAIWAAGDNQGGRPSTVVLSADTTYHYFVIKKSDGTIDAGYDTSLLAVNLLAESTYIYFRRVRSLTTDGSANIRPTKQLGNHFELISPYLSQSISGNGGFPTTRTNFDIGVPHDIVTEATMLFTYIQGSAGNYPAAFLITDPAQTDVVVSGANADFNIKPGGAGTEWMRGRLSSFTNTSGEIAVRSSDVGDRPGESVNIKLISWIDPRLAEIN